LVAAAKFLVAATKNLFVDRNFASVPKPFFPWVHLTVTNPNAAYFPTAGCCRREVSGIWLGKQMS